MKYITALFFLPLLLGAQEYIKWQPAIKKMHQKGMQAHNSHSGRKAKQLQLKNINQSADLQISYILPTLAKKELSHKMGLITIPRTGMDNYHALVVQQSYKKSVSSSIRYIYSHGKPSKTSPTKITQLQKSDFEITPSPLPREHDRYKSSESYSFKLNFKGRGLSFSPVILETSNGSKQNFQSSSNGEFEITLPNDFKDVKKGRRANKPVEFVLKALHLHEGTTYSTTFTMPYHVNPSDYWQLQSYGLLLLIIGLITGIYIFRNIHKKKKRRA